MKLASRTIVSVLGRAVACLLAVPRIGGQTESAEKPLMTEQYFKNVQVLRSISVKEFTDTTGFFAASLGENCTFCHVEESGGDWSKHTEDNANKQTARKMILMMTAINKSYFGGRRMPTCYSCHRGGETPRVTPNLAEQYRAPVLEVPDEITEQAPGAPSADQILDKYIQALGGAQRLAALTSVVARGTKMDASLSFPAGIKQLFSQWRVGFPTTINDHDVQVVQGSNPGESPVKFYFRSAVRLAGACGALHKLARRPQSHTD